MHIQTPESATDDGWHHCTHHGLHCPGMSRHRYRVRNSLETFSRLYTGLNRRFPRSMRSQGERPGCGSHVKRVDTEMLSTHRPLSRRLDRCDRVIQKESGDPNGGNMCSFSWATGTSRVRHNADYVPCAQIRFDL